MNMSDKIDNKDLRLKVFNKYRGRCAYCGCEIKIDKFSIDHINAKFRGWNDDELKKYGKTKGDDSILNYNPSCYSCNSSKSTLTIEQWKSEISKKYDRLLKYDATFRLLNRFNLCIRNDKNILFYFETQK